MAIVGRRADLETLENEWRLARDGTPRLIMLRGAPGIGKTTLLTELLGGIHDGTVLRGTCHEDSSLPYLSVGTALRPLWPEGTSPFERLGRNATPTTPLTPASLEQRLDLVLDVTATLIQRAEREPVLIALDDAHWADPATVELLAHLLQSLGDAAPKHSLLVLLAMRPIGGDTPAARLVERAARDPSARTHDVAGLDTVSLHHLVVELTGKRPSKPFLRGLERSSGGNPLLVKSLIGRLEAFGGMVVRGDMLVQTSAADPLASPRDLDQLLRDRLAHVSEACRRVLVVAAFLGDHGSLDTLVQLAGVDADRFERALDEAREAHLLDDDGDSYQFDHPQLRQVLYQTPRGNRRGELHLRIATHLESTGDMDDPADSIAVAHHLRRAGKDVEPHRLLESALRAANAAEGMAAWADAAEAYDTALTVNEGEGGVFRAHIASRGALAHWWNQDNERAAELADEAVRLARAANDLDLWATALELRARAGWSGPTVATVSRPDVAPYVEFLDAVGERRDDLRARTNWLIASTCATATDLKSAERHLAEATRLAELSGTAMRGDLTSCQGVIDLVAARPAAAARSFSDAAQALETEDPRRVGFALSRAALAQWMGGHLDEAAGLAAEAAVRTAEVGKFAESGMAKGIAAGVANCLGDERALRLADDAARITHWSRFGQATPFVFPALARAHAERGDFIEAHAAIDQLAEFGSPAARFLRPLLHAMEGDHVTARIGLDDLLSVRAPDRLLGLLSAIHVRVAQLLGESLDSERSAAILEAIADTGVRYETSWGFDLRELSGTK